MAPSNEPAAKIDAELIRRHKAAATTVLAFIGVTALLCIVAYFSKGFLVEQNNPSLDIALRITILIFGLGAVALRRTRFSTMRLQDIGALRGASGLLQTLQRTTLLVALLGAATAILGFTATVMTGNEFYTYGAGLVSFAILLYCYPVRRSWKRALAQLVQSDSPS